MTDAGRRLCRRRVPELRRGVTLPAEYRDPRGRALTTLEWNALATLARTGNGQAAADALDMSLGALQHAVERAYTKLGTHSAIDAFRSLGWLRIPNDGPPVPVVLTVRTTKAGT